MKKGFKKKFQHNLKVGFANTYKFSNHDTINLLRCFEKDSTHRKTLMIGINSMKHHGMRKKIFTDT